MGLLVTHCLALCVIVSLMMDNRSLGITCVVWMNAVTVGLIAKGNIDIMCNTSQI